MWPSAKLCRWPDSWPSANLPLPKKCLPMALCRRPRRIAIGKAFADGNPDFADGCGPSANKPDLVVDVVVREPTGVPGEQACQAPLHRRREPVVVEALDPLLHRVLDGPEDAVPAHGLAVTVAEVEQRVGVGVVELPLLRLRVVPLELPQSKCLARSRRRPGSGSRSC